MSSTQFVDVGFTGSRFGMDDDQAAEVQQFLWETNPYMARHGDCVGADKDFHLIARNQDIPVIIHPPIGNLHRAFCEDYYHIHPPKKYAVRDRDIVDACDILLATPCCDEVIRSGTWMTVRYAERTGVPVKIFGEWARI